MKQKRIRKVYLGSYSAYTSANFDVTKYKNYTSFSTSNFGMDISAVYGGQPIDTSDSGSYGSIQYNPSIGIVTFPIKRRYILTGIAPMIQAYLYYIE